MPSFRKAGPALSRLSTAVAPAGANELDPAPLAISTCTWNPADKSADLTLSGGNLTAAVAVGSHRCARATQAIPPAKYYWEGMCTAIGSGTSYGVGNSAASLTNFVGSDVNGWGYSTTGSKTHNGGTAYGDIYTSGDVIGVAVDLASGKIWFAKNGVWQASGNPASGAVPAFAGLSGTLYPMVNGNGGTVWTAAFSSATVAASGGATQAKYGTVYAPPAGFLALP